LRVGEVSDAAYGAVRVDASDEVDREVRLRIRGAGQGEQEGVEGGPVAAWSAPGAEEGTTGGMNMPARLVGSMALLDLTVHVWDLARATGQEYPGADEAVAAELSGAVDELAPTARKMGVFGEPVPVAEGASVFERLLGRTGRDPYWNGPAPAVVPPGTVEG
jgi:uncharacterized protein (TIGR03086 family)